MTIREIAEKRGCSYETIRKRIRGYNIPHQGERIDELKNISLLYDYEPTILMIEEGLKNKWELKKPAKKKIAPKPIKITEDMMTYAPRCIPETMLPISVLWNGL